MSTDKQEKRIKVPSTKQARIDKIADREAEEDIRKALRFLLEEDEESFDVPRILPKRIVGKRIPVVSAEIESEENN